MVGWNKLCNPDDELVQKDDGVPIIPNRHYQTKIEEMGICSKDLKVVQKTAAVARRKFDERRRENKRFLVGLLLSAGSYEVNTRKQGV